MKTSTQLLVALSAFLCACADDESTSSTSLDESSGDSSSDTDVMESGDESVGGSSAASSSGDDEQDDGSTDATSGADDDSGDASSGSNPDVGSTGEDTCDDSVDARYARCDAEFETYYYCSNDCDLLADELEQVECQFGCVISLHTSLQTCYAGCDEAVARLECQTSCYEDVLECADATSLECGSAMEACLDTCGRD